MTVTVSVDDVFFTPRAFERIRMHFPRCGVRGARAILAASAEVSPAEVDQLTGKRAPPNVKPTTFYRTENGKGIFVIVPADDQDHGRSRHICATYIRLVRDDQENQ